MCYAFAEIMVSQTGRKYKYTQKQVNSVAAAWGRWKYRNLEDELQYKEGGSPNVSGKLLSEDEIIEALKQHPIYAFGNGHVWVITGYAKAPGHDAIFTINDSEGPARRVFTFEEMSNMGYTQFKAPGLTRIEQILTPGDFYFRDMDKLFTGGIIEIVADGKVIDRFQGMSY